MRDTPNRATIKTSAPSLEGVIERPRLLTALSQLPAASKWLQAPSGTGKSTLAASYARSIGKPCAWYRLDERDNDPAFFFDEFARGVSAQLALSKSLPKFTGDDHDRHQQFAHRFAAALTAQFRKPSLLVIDDVQHVTSDEMQVALAALIAAATKDSELLFVSQSTAPTAFFDAIAARRLSLLNDADLSFNSAECNAMTAALRVEGAHCEDIAALTGGHAGALVLACELLRGSDPKSALGAATVERIHLHLLTKLIDRMPVTRRELMVRTAYVAQLTRAIAETLAGPEAASEIDPLVESGLLRRVGSGKDEVFEAHALVRQGMQALVRARMGRSKASVLAERTAKVLSAGDQREAAFDLLTEVGSTTRAIEELRYLAERYAKRGQADLLLNSIAKVPASEVQRDPWLCFWTGQALLQVDEEQARVWFGRCYSAFEVTQDTYGMRLAAASVVTAYALECGDRRGLDEWVGRHSTAGGDEPAERDTPFETTLLMGVAATAFVRSTYPKAIDPDSLIQRLQNLLDSDQSWLSEDQKVQAARILVEQGHVFGKYEMAKNAIVATRPLIDLKVGSDLQRGRWLIIAAYAHFADVDTKNSLGYLTEAKQLADASQSTRLTFELGLAFADRSMQCQDFQHAAAQLRELESVSSRAPPAQRAEYARLMTRLLLLQGRSAEGLRWAVEAKRLAMPAGFTGPNLRAFQIELVYALAANDQFAAAVDALHEETFEPHEVRIAVEQCLKFLISKRTDWQALQTGLKVAAQIGFFNLLDRARKPLVEVCEAALRNGIETEFIIRLIDTKKLDPPPLAGATWPWPIKVWTLGGFRLEIGGARYQPAHKAQEKPLELLKLLVTCQALGRDSAEKNWICERLWPETEAEKARKSLDMTVARLRRILENDDAIVLHEGRLQLSPVHVWTDVRLLRQALSHARQQNDDHITRKPAVDAKASVVAVLDQYGGQFLAEEEGPPWMLAGRETIVAAVRHTLLTADKLLDGTADELLIPALRKALVADPTSEDVARSLMHAHLRCGQYGEAINVYRRLRDMLSLVLGITPSAETEHVRSLAYIAESNSAMRSTHA